MFGKEEAGEAEGPLDKAKEWKGTRESVISNVKHYVHHYYDKKMYKGLINIPHL